MFLMCKVARNRLSLLSLSSQDLRCTFLPTHFRESFVQTEAQFGRRVGGGGFLAIAI